MIRLRCLILLTLALLSLAAQAGNGPCIKRGQQLSNLNWQLVYNEEFRGNKTIDQNWTPQNASPSHILSSRWRDNLSVRKGKLIISNRKEERGGKEWTSGSMRGRNCSYGFYECRMKISKATGVNNSFWMSAAKKPGMNAFELDFCEVHYPNKINYTIHDYGGEKMEKNPTVTYVYKPDMDLSAAYHVYGCYWDKDTISFYFDGKLIWETPNLVCDHAGPFVLGTAILKWAGEVTEKIDGTNMKVDYVRVWQKVEN